MERLRWEKERAVVQTYGLVSGQSRDSVNDADDFWEDEEEERRRAPQKPSAAERQSKLMAVSLTQLLSVSFQEKAQSLQRSDLDAFLLSTLKESPSFSAASPTDLESAVEYLKQVLGTLHGLDVCPTSDVRAQADQGAPTAPTPPAVPGDAGRSALAAGPGDASKPSAGANGGSFHGAHSTTPMQGAGAHHQDAPQAGSASPSGTATGSEPSLNNAAQYPDRSAHEWQQQHLESNGSPPDAASASLNQSPAQAFSTGLQQQQQQQQQGLGHLGHQTPGPWAPPMPYPPPPMHASHAMDPYNAFLSAAASAASAAAAAFAGSWARPPGSNPSVSPLPNFLPLSAAASHHTSPSSDPQAQDARWPQHPAQPQQQQQQQQHWAQQPRHTRSHRRATTTNRNPRSNDRAGGGAFGGVSRRTRGGSDSGGSDGSDCLEGRSSSPEPEPQALDSRMASAAAQMKHGGGDNAAAGVAAHADAAELHQQHHHPFPSATAVRVVKHDEGPRIKARVPPSGPIELRPPSFQVFRDLQPPFTGAEQPLPLPKQHPLPPPSPYSSPPISPPRSPPLSAVRPSPRARDAAQLTPTPAPSRARVPLPHHQPKPSPQHSLTLHPSPLPAPNPDSEPWRSSPAPVPTGPPPTSALTSKPSAATYFPPNTRSLFPNPGHVPHGQHAANAPAMLGTGTTAPASPQQPTALHPYAPAQHAILQGQHGSSMQVPDVQKPQSPTRNTAHHHPAALQPVHLPPQPPVPPRQPVPLPPELQGSVQRTLEFLENPLSFAPGAPSDVGGSSYPPRVSFVTAEQQAAQRWVGECIWVHLNVLGCIQAQAGV
ncbi:hypothetical protein DUNSADRAFT_3294 [Dunaliella salina]|uniref:Uncharacterized protein n=1 Tax=Dunaliella salina TaxID=3046 RepID=A0ABQ7GU73_DUNSA|nr:hypothetical protein DUNSADRAFT_3294 [Dunaliella salina]|eukprot:KAF5838169.1 hypothetical protein DUNSADRAFT_3294 [Dunaliella salina]